MTKKITSLTEDQKSLLSVYRDKWLKIGLCTEPSNRPLAEDAIRRAYEMASLTPPSQIIWTTSPLAGAALVSILKDDDIMKKVCEEYEKHLDKKITRKDLGASVWDSVRASVGESVWASVWASVRASVGESVRDSVGESVMASVGASVGASVWESVMDSVGESEVGS